MRPCSVSKNLVEFRHVGRNKMKIHVIRRLRRPDRTAVSGFTAYGCRVPLAGKNSYRLASVSFCPLYQIGTQRSGSDLERRSNAMYELCRLRRREGYAVCFDERAVEAQPLPAKALLLLVLVGYGKPCSSFCCRVSMILEI